MLLTVLNACNAVWKVRLSVKVNHKLQVLDEGNKFIVKSLQMMHEH